ncbi:MAG: glycogen synthase GlgA [Oscillospiraceae bacterium]|jgi:starch synthase|nr:glycogen synthase GlgA [Oscillospiraceae bacterium]
MKILFVSPEAQPFISTGGLAEVAGSLPKALRKKRVGVRVVLPLYQDIPDALRDNMRFVTNITVPVAWRRQYCGIFEAKVDGVIYYLLDNEYYFKRPGAYGYYDDAERFAFFSRAALEILPHIDFKPNVIHANDWQTALVPVYYSTLFATKPGYENIKTVFTLHNMQYQGEYGHELLGEVIGLPPKDHKLVEFGENVNLLKGGIECADAVTTVSPSYAQEILDPWFSHGLDPLLRAREWKLSGILNGIDTEVYDPTRDPLIAAQFSAAQPQGKAACKAALQEEYGLPVDAAVPLLSMVTRLTGHKGLDLLRPILYDFLRESGAQFVVLGSGEWEYEQFFKQVQQDFPQQFGLYLGFNAGLSHRIYAGSDLFLMPSRAEPCGLSQMIALRYGTVPIVRAVGGLRDSIQDAGDGAGNGFTFQSYNAHDMRGALDRALAVYAQPEAWQALQQRGMACDFSWNVSALEYLRLYKAISK